MIRVKGSMKSEKAIELIQGRLAKFNLNWDMDIVATITDVASVMTKVGRETSPLHIACLSHVFHLCICDVGENGVSRYTFQFLDHKSETT